MKKLVLFLSTVLLLLSCGEDSRHVDANDVTLKFTSTWNIYEKCAFDEDENVLYEGIPWGGLVGNFLQQNMPVDLSDYESVTFEFIDPLPVPVQVVVANKFKTVGKKGLTSLTCYFDGQDVTSVNEIVLQPHDSCNIRISHVYLTPGNNTKWVSNRIWKGECAFEDWAGGFVLKPENFASANEGDKLEFIFEADNTSPEIKYWLLKTIYNTTSETLEGNDSELNEWGCASVSSTATSYRIRLTAKDIEYLRKFGAFVNGYYLNITQVNLLRKQISYDE